MSNTKNSIVPFVILIIFSTFAMVAGMYFSGNLSVKHKPVIEGTLFDKAKPLEPFSLIDHQKQTFNAASFKGKWSFVFFGYTQCPDVCPQTMQILKAISIEFNKQWHQYPLFSNTQFVFVSVDPARDTPDKLAKYVSFFGKNFIGITGKNAQLDAITRQFGILHKVTPHKDPAKYQVDHGGHIMLINPQGEWQAMFRYPHNDRKMVYDYYNIREYLK